MLIDPTDRFLLKKGREEGRKEGKLDVAHSMIDKGYSIDEVVELTGLSKVVILDSK